jgi:pseudouridine synthase
VNGKTERDPNRWVDLQGDRVAIDGAPLRPASKAYLLLYRPKGYLSTRADPAGRPTVYDLLEGAKTWLIPVGRLDQDTSGLLLMTNDTAFAERVANPAHGVVKTYEVKAASLLSDEQIERLRAGVELKDGPARPARVRRLRDGPRHTYLEIAIGEGRNREVRRMMEAIGSKALKLVRTAIGPIRIGELPIGKWRWLTPEEVRSVGGAAGAGGSAGAGLASGPRTRRGVNRGRYRGSGALDRDSPWRA